jgi:hypothetical protein
MGNIVSNVKRKEKKNKTAFQQCVMGAGPLDHTARMRQK